MQVAALTPAMESAYAAFVPRDAVTAIYATLEFRNFLSASAGGTPTYLVAADGDRIVGALPMFEARDSEWGRVINSLPWYGSHGGCVLGDAADAATRTALLTAARPMWRADDVAFATMVLSHDETAHAARYHALLEPIASDSRTGQITPLPANGADLEARLEKCLLQKTRNLARKSLRQGFVLDDGDDDAGWEYLISTHHENLAALGGKAKPRTHFDAMRRCFPSSWRRLLIARLDGEPVAALLLLRFGRTVEYLTPVITHAFRSQQPMSFLIWHGMLAAIRDGFSFWNWGGTWASQESLHHFKAGWGAESRSYQYVSRARSDAKAALAADPAGMMNRFPYYFLFPLPLNG